MEIKEEGYRTTRFDASSHQALLAGGDLDIHVHFVEGGPLGPSCDLQVLLDAEHVAEGAKDVTGQPMVWLCSAGFVAIAIPELSLFPFSS